MAYDQRNATKLAQICEILGFTMVPKGYRMFEVIMSDGTSLGTMSALAWIEHIQHAMEKSGRS